MERPARVLVLPGFDQEQGGGARRMDGQPSDTAIDAAASSSFTTMGISTMGAQSPDAFNSGVQAAQDVAHIRRQ